MVSNTTAAISESLQAEKWGHDSRNVFLEHSRTERKQDILLLKKNYASLARVDIGKRNDVKCRLLSKQGSIEDVRLSIKTLEDE